MREAIKRLEVDHLVVSYPRRGTFATTVDFTELADVSEIRELLEPLAARRAAKRANTAMRGELLDVAKAISELAPTPAQSRELMRYDLTVHRLIYRAAANPHLEDTLVRYDNLATRIWCLVLDKVPSVSGHISRARGPAPGGGRGGRGQGRGARAAPRHELRGDHPQGAIGSTLGSPHALLPASRTDILPETSAANEGDRRARYLPLPGLTSVSKEARRVR